MLSVSGFSETRQALSLGNPAPSPDSTIPKFTGLVRVADTKSAPGTERFRSRIAPYAFFTPNRGDTLWVVPVDVDHTDALHEVLWAVAEGKVPDPSWVVHNPATGHCQVAWIVETVYAPGKRHDYAPYRLYYDLWATLTDVLRGDPLFSRHRMRNPWYQGAEVRWGKTEPRRMADLIREVRAAGAARPMNAGTSSSASWGAAVSEGGLEPGSRNTGIFDALRYRAYALARQGTYAVEVLEEAAKQENRRCSEPLTDGEVRGIVTSIDRYIARRYRPRGGSDGGARGPGDWGPGPSPGFSARQSFLGRRGGQRRTHAQRRALAEGNRARQAVKSRRDQAIIALAESEPHLTRLEIQDRLGESRTRVQTVLSSHRTTPVATSTTPDRTAVSPACQVLPARPALSCLDRPLVHRAAHRCGGVSIALRCTPTGAGTQRVVVRDDQRRVRIERCAHPRRRRSEGRNRNDVISHQIIARAGPQCSRPYSTCRNAASDLALFTR